MEIGLRNRNGSKTGEMRQTFALFYFIEIAGKAASALQNDMRMQESDQGQRKGQPDMPAIFQNLRLTAEAMPELLREWGAVLAASSIAGQHGAVGVHFEIQIVWILLIRSKAEKGLHGGIQTDRVVIIPVNTAGIRLLTCHLQKKSGVWQKAQTSGCYRTVAAAPVESVYGKERAEGKMICGRYGVYIISCGSHKASLL